MSKMSIGNATKAATSARNQSSVLAVAEGRPSKQEEEKQDKEKKYAFNVKMPPSYEFLIKEAILKTQKETGERVSMNQFIVDAIKAKLGIS